MCPAPTEAGLARIIHCAVRTTHSYGERARSRIVRPFTGGRTGSSNGRGRHSLAAAAPELDIGRN